MDIGKTLGFLGDIAVKYLDVVSGGDSITMMVRLTGGSSSMIQPPIIVLKNATGSYLSGVCLTTYQGSAIGRVQTLGWIAQYYCSGLQNRVLLPLATMETYAFCMWTIVLVMIFEKKVYRH